MTALEAVVAEVETHVAEAGWDQPPQLFALVETEQLLRAEPQLAETMGIVAGPPGSLTPVAQDPLADLPLDEALARIEFGDAVLGVVLAHEVLVLPPSAEAELTGRPRPGGQDGAEPSGTGPTGTGPSGTGPTGTGPAGTGSTDGALLGPAAADDPAIDAEAAAAHPAAREVRMVVGVVRDGTRAAVLRLRGRDGTGDDRVTGPDLAPALAEALLATLA